MMEGYELQPHLDVIMVEECATASVWPAFVFEDLQIQTCDCYQLCELASLCVLLFTNMKKMPVC